MTINSPWSAGLDRREFVTGAAASFGLMALGLGDGSGAVGPLVDAVEDWLLIDVHCHCFNAADIPAGRFVAMKLQQESVAWAQPLIEWLVDLLTKSAPTAEDEFRVLDREGVRLLAIDGAVHPSTAVREAKFFDALDARVGKAELRKSTGRARDPLLEQIEMERRTLTDTDKKKPGMREIALKGDGPVGRYCRFASLLLRYRFEIVREHIRRYPGIHLLTPLIVDFDSWLLRGPDADLSTPVAVQLELLSRINKKLAGEGAVTRVHPFVGFDPRRAIGNSCVLEEAKKAVNVGGAVGVKLYPPMGFRPIGNEHAPFPDREGGDELGRQLDSVLEELYLWCEENSVPVVAHCADSNYSDRVYAEDRRASPHWWRRVISTGDSGHPQLAVDLGHSGATSSQDWGTTPDHWPQLVGCMMRPDNRLHSDLSYHPAVTADQDANNHYFKSLSEFIGANPLAGDRLMYGSDWAMVEVEKGARTYLSEFMRGSREVLKGEQTRKILGANAAAFLGIRDGEPGRARLLNYYKREELTTPEFLRRAVKA